MIVKIENGEEKVFKIKYFSEEVNLQNFKDKAVEIEVDENYWEPILGLQEVPAYLIDRNVRGKQGLKNAPEYFSKYWVETEVFDSVKKLLLTECIDVKLANQLSILVSDYPFSVLVPEGSDIKEAASQFVALKSMFEQLKKRQRHIVSIRFELGDLSGFKEARPKYENTEFLSIQNDRIVGSLASVLVRMAKFNPEFNKFLNNSVYPEYSDITAGGLHRGRRDRMIAITYNALLHYLPDKASKYLMGLTGRILRLADPKYLLSESEFNQDKNKKVQYSSYKECCENLMAARIRPLRS